MRTFNYKKIFFIFAFVALAGFSCFWTAESLYIWQPSITIIGAWLIAIVFYIVASICFSKFLQSLDRNADFWGQLGGRWGAFFLGLIGLVVFWLGVSLPTNTHTLLYRASIKSIISNDLHRTQGYLDGLKDNNVKINEINERYKNKHNAVDVIIKRLIKETEHPGQIGIGHRFETILVELDALLSDVTLGSAAKIQRVAKPGTTPKQWLTAVNYYQAQAYDILKLYRIQCDKEIAEVRRAMDSKMLAGLIKNNQIATSDISKMKTVNNEIIDAALNDLTNGYSYIAKNSQYIDFKENDKEKYTREGALPDAKAMQSVPDVWIDFITTDKYDGHGFAWWIIIALLVDLSAFIFFDLAKK